MVTKDIISLAIKKAKQSQCRYKISALGFNSSGELVVKKTNYQRFPRQGGSLHAEMAVMALHRKYGIRTILICRVNPSGNMLPIKPCYKCREKAEELGIKIITVQN